jgi:hypothetical protein
MGLLDDAIREHLELKRVRGADPGEVIRQERELLGTAPHGEELDMELRPVEDEPPGADATVDALGGDDASNAGDEVVSDSAYEEGTSVPHPGSGPQAGGESRVVADEGGEGARVTPEQETAEVDMQAMLRLEDEAQIAGEAADADYQEEDDVAGAGDSWGEPPQAHQ